MGGPPTRRSCFHSQVFHEGVKRPQIWGYKDAKTGARSSGESHNTTCVLRRVACKVKLYMPHAHDGYQYLRLSESRSALPVIITIIVMLVHQQRISPSSSVVTSDGMHYYHDRLSGLLLVHKLARSTSNSMFWHSVSRLVVDWDTLQNDDTKPILSLVSA